MQTIKRNTAKTLRKLKITRRYKGYQSILSAMELIAEDESRLTAVSKEIYMVISHKEGVTWKAVHRNIKTVVHIAWNNNRKFLGEIAGCELTELPCPAEFLSMLFGYASKDY